MMVIRYHSVTFFIKTKIYFGFIGRPCQRCIKRSIGHLCHDEIKNSSNANHNKTNGSAPPVKKASNSTASSYIDTSSTIIPVVPQHLVGKIKKKKKLHYDLYIKSYIFYCSYTKQLGWFTTTVLWANGNRSIDVC